MKIWEEKNKNNKIDFFLLPTESELIDIAFRKTEKKVQNTKKIKEKEIMRINSSADEIEKKIRKAVKSIPKLNEMPLFYQELIKLIINQKELLRALGHLNKSSKIIKKIKQESLRKIRREKNKEKIIQIRKGFYGRMNSVIKKLKKSIKEYNNAQKKLRELPSIELNEKTIILSGYPNTGKTTILKRITTSKPKIASYPFTTTKINKGKMNYKYYSFQIVDLPGLLDREIEKRNNIEKKAILALKYLDSIIVFVIDPTEDLGNTIKKQKKLLNELKKEFKKEFIIVVNKADIATKKELNNALKKFKTNIIDSKEIKGENLRKTLIKKLEKNKEIEKKLLKQETLN